MRETSGIKRHDATTPSADLPQGEASEPGAVGKIAATIAGVAGASQVVGWGAHGTKPEKGKAPSVDTGADVSTSALDASVPVPSIEGGAEAPAVEGEMTLPSGSATVEGELRTRRRGVLCKQESSSRDERPPLFVWTAPDGVKTAAERLPHFVKKNANLCVVLPPGGSF